MASLSSCAGEASAEEMATKKRLKGQIITKGLIRISCVGVDRVFDRSFVLLDRDLILSGARSVIVVLGVAGGNATGHGVVLLFVLIIGGGRHDDKCCVN